MLVREWETGENGKKGVVRLHYNILSSLGSLREEEERGSVPCLSLGGGGCGCGQRRGDRARPLSKEERTDRRIWSNPHQNGGREEKKKERKSLRSLRQPKRREGEQLLLKPPKCGGKKEGRRNGIWPQFRSSFMLLQQREREERGPLMSQIAKDCIKERGGGGGRKEKKVDTIALRISTWLSARASPMWSRREGG